MSLVAAVKDRIASVVSALEGKLDTVADLAALVQEGALPQREVTAFVVPLGFDARGGESATGLHTQMLNRAVGVVLCIRTHGDATARRSLPTIDGLERDVVAAVAGWAPDDVAGVFAVTRGRLVSVAAGLVIYQLDFELLDQLRILPS